ncbi:MAG: amidohydrolase family protein, partial [Candidatus Omnitrophica bacterium]|nr:amidohydrolase family protein [Candidatus Omnitrophota bacterium]
AHSHYMPPAVAENTAFFKVAWSDLNRQLSLMDECGIEKSLLLYPTSDAHLNMGGWQNVCQAYNPTIADIVKAHEGRFIGAGILPADSPEQFEEELKRIHDLGLKVLTLASSYEGVYLDDERFLPVYEFARDHNMPIHVHPQIMNPIGESRVKDPLLTPVLEYVFDVSMCIGKMMMSGTFAQFPEVKFIFAHYGGVLPFVKERFDNTYMMLRKRNFVKDLSKLPGDYFRNLYFDMSGTKSRAALQGTLEVTDASHILFGSDFPANQNIRQSIAVIQDASFSDEDKAKIMKSVIFSEF